jgi:hypothetical protein
MIRYKDKWAFEETCFTHFKKIDEASFSGFLKEGMKEVIFTVDHPHDINSLWDRISDRILLSVDEKNISEQVVKSLTEHPDDQLNWS